MLLSRKTKHKQSSVTPTRMRANDSVFLPLFGTPTPKITRMTSNTSIGGKYSLENYNSTPDILKFRASREPTLGSPTRSPVRPQNRSNNTQGPKLLRIRKGASVNKLRFAVCSNIPENLKLNGHDVQAQESNQKAPLSDRKSIELEEFLASYQPLDSQFFENLKSLSNNKLIHYTIGYYYGQFSDDAHNGKGTCFAVVILI